MKKLSAVLMVSAAAILGIGLASCGGEGGVSTSTVDKTASSIRNTIGSNPFAVGTEINLDDYITVVYSNGTEDKDYTVSCSNANVTIAGHKATPTAVGTYTLDVSSSDGARSIRVSIDARSAEVMEIIDFLSPITTNTSNFIIDCYETSKSGSISRYQSAVHNEHYGVNANLDDLGETYGGEPNSLILAELSDGNYYQGYFNQNGQPVFKPGVESNYANYFICMPTSLNPLGINEVEMETATGATQTVIAGDASFSQEMCWAASYPIDQIYDIVFIGYSYSEVLGLYDTDGDGTKDTLIVKPSYVMYEFEYDDEGNPVPVLDDDGNMIEMEPFSFSNVILGIRNIGTASLDVMENVRNDASYLPQKLEASELQTSFAAVSAAKNYTVDIAAYPSDDTGAKLYSAAAGSAYSTVFGTSKPIYQTNSVTSEGVLGELGTLSNGGSGETKDAATMQTGYFNRDGQGYSFTVGSYPLDESTSGDEGTANTPINEVTALDGVTDVFAGAASAQTVADVTGFGELNITSKTTNGNEVTVVSEVGDNDGTTKANTLFETLFNQMTAYTIGESWTEAVEFTGGDYHALTIYSDYIGLTCDTVTNEIHIEVLVYLPIGLDDAYVVLTYDVSSIGTTTADFSGFQPSQLA